MKEKIDDQILKKFSGGNYSLKDFKIIRHWFEDKSLEPAIKQTLQQHWDESAENQITKNRDLSTVFEQLKQKISTRKTPHTFRQKIQAGYAKVAAILLIPLLLYSVYSTYKTPAKGLSAARIEIYSPLGARTHFNLPDGTQGWLNSGSVLTYSSNFTDVRNVALSGEAWFDVAHNQQKPFKVSTPTIDVQVLGTKFNITAFPDEKITEVVLQEGKVEVNGTEKSFSTELKPDEKFTYNQELKSGTVQSVNAEQFSSWKDGLLVFRNDPLSEVLKRIGRWYNVDILINDTELAKFRYRATFQEEQIEEVIRLIALTVPIKYSFGARQVDENGVFQKRIITISKK